MKKQITIGTTTFMVFTLLLTLFFASSVNAQESQSSGKVIIEKYQLKTNAVKSLLVGIKSENRGLRNSAIFYAGQYKLEEAFDYLIEELQKEEDPGTKILIALSLYKIGDPIAIEYIKDMVSNESNPKVKHMFSAIYDEFVINSSITTVNK
ncbi:MAG: HEAT repeat domain-containing protein [Bacteroidetes bacterium]|nr:HEAT repeat domain-containing protein [Bacteroidota bacterium]